MSVNTATNASSSKRVLVLFGSPHKDGPTKKLLDAFLDELDQPDVQMVDAFAGTIRPCNDCGACKTQTNCVIEDGLVQKIEWADFIVVASPVYFLSFPAPLKQIVDRFQVFFSRRFVHGMRPTMARAKKGVLLACSGSEDDRGFTIMKQQLMMAFSVMHTAFVGSVCLSGTDQNGFCMQRVSDQIERLVCKIS